VAPGSSWIGEDSLQQIGAYADGPLVVLDVQRGRALDGRIETVMYPTPARPGPNQPTVSHPASVPVALLGAEVAQLLEANGRGKQKEIGFPISIHYFGADQSDVACAVAVGGKPVEGKLVHATQGTRRTAAPGMWVFYPYAPLPKGSTVSVTWTLKGKDETLTFSVGG